MIRTITITSVNMTSTWQHDFNMTTWLQHDMTFVGKLKKIFWNLNEISWNAMLQKFTVDSKNQYMIFTGWLISCENVSNCCVFCKPFMPNLVSARRAFQEARKKASSKIWTPPIFYAYRTPTRNRWYTKSKWAGKPWNAKSYGQKRITPWLELPRKV